MAKTQGGKKVPLKRGIGQTIQENNHLVNCNSSALRGNQTVFRLYQIYLLA